MSAAGSREAAAPLRLALTRRTVAVPMALGLLALLVALAGACTALDLARQVPRLGMLVTDGGYVVLLDPNGPAARAGIHVGDTITAVDGHAPSAAAFSSLRAHVRGDVMALSEGKPGTFRLFWVPVVGPSQTELAGDGAALASAVALWLSGLLVGLRRRETAACLYAPAALALALGLCALVARDDGSLWPWPALVPPMLAGLGALLLAQRALVGSLPTALVAGVVAVAGVPALLAVLGAFVALPAAAGALVAAALCGLALSVLAFPLAVHGYTRSEPCRRRLRVALVASTVGLLPLYLWPGLAAVAALAGQPGAADTGVRVSPLWGTAGLVPMALLYGALFLTPRLDRLDARTRMGAAYAAALALLGGALAVVVPAMSWAGRATAVTIAVLVLPMTQQGIARLVDRVTRRPRPDYAAALRAVQDLMAGAASAGDLAVSVAAVLPAQLSVRAAHVLVRGLECPPDAYRLFGASGGDGEVVRVDPPLEARSLDAARAAVLLHDPDAFSASARAQPASSAIGDPALVRRQSRALSPAGDLWGRLDTALLVPLWWDGAQRGILALGPRVDDDPYEEPDLRQIDTLAGLLALGLKAQELVSHLQERTTSLASLTHRLSHAHEQERAHLSRELHDVVAQELIALTRQLRRYGDGAAPPPAIWADMLAAAQDALAATRRICNGLRPAMLDLGLAPAVRDLVAQGADRDGRPEISLTIDGPERRLPGEIEFALFRVAQEGVNNALAHSGAGQIRVEVCFDDGVCVRVRDDGRGFVVPPRFEDLPGDHLGLIGMRERLAELGGVLSLTSAPGQGTLVEARVPCVNQ